MGKGESLKVGIFMPAYNQGEYIDDAIECLKKQTFQDFVVHIVDDCSDDGKTIDKLKSVAYEKAKVFLPKENRGVAYRAREHFKMLDTQYVLVLCADDIIAPEFLEKTVSFLDRNPKYGAVSVNIKLFNKNIEEAYAEKDFDEKKMDLKHELARNQILGSSLMRKKALDDTDLSGGFDRYQDWDRWISMMEAGWKIGLVPEVLFYYRQTPKSLSHTASVEDELEIKKKLLKKHEESYKKYYKDVIIEMEEAFLELLQGKNWLEEQYNRMNKDIKRLEKEVRRYEYRTLYGVARKGFKKMKRRIK